MEQSNTVVKFPTTNETIFMPLSENYVEHWGFWEAVREFIQNAIDADDSASIKYSNGILSMRSIGEMDPSSLLLGESGKRHDSTAIGTYGEGYKLALLVLTRMGYTVVIENNGATWTTSFQEHPQLKANCLAINIEQTGASIGYVDVRVSGVGVRDFAELKEKYLPLRHDYKVICEHEDSQVVKFDSDNMDNMDSDDYDGDSDSIKQVFVKGLYICDLPEKEGYWFSYNLTPDRIELDRDRQSVDSWDLQYQATVLLTECGEADLLARMAMSNAADISGSFENIISGNYGGSSFKSQINEMAEKAFEVKYGIKAYPISAGWNSSKKLYYTEAAMKLGMVAIQLDPKQYAMLSKTFRERTIAHIPTSYKSINEELRAFMVENKKHMRAKPLKKLELLVAKYMIRGI